MPKGAEVEAESVEQLFVEPDHLAADSAAQEMPTSHDYYDVDPASLSAKGLINACPYYGRLAAINPELAEQQAASSLESARQMAVDRSAGQSEEAARSNQWSAMRARHKQKTEQAAAQPEDPKDNHTEAIEPTSAVSNKEITDQLTQLTETAKVIDHSTSVESITSPFVVINQPSEPAPSVLREEHVSYEPTVDQSPAELIASPTPQPAIEVVPTIDPVLLHALNEADQAANDSPAPQIVETIAPDPVVLALPPADILSAETVQENAQIDDDVETTTEQTASLTKSEFSSESIGQPIKPFGVQEHTPVEAQSEIEDDQPAIMETFIAMLAPTKPAIEHYTDETTEYILLNDDFSDTIQSEPIPSKESSINPVNSILVEALTAVPSEKRATLVPVVQSVVEAVRAITTFTEQTEVTSEAMQPRVVALTEQVAVLFEELDIHFTTEEINQLVKQLIHAEIKTQSLAQASIDLPAIDLETGAMHEVKTRPHLFASAIMDVRQTMAQQMGRLMLFSS